MENIWDKLITGFNNYVHDIDPSNFLQKFFSILITLLLAKMALSFGNRVIDGVVNANRFKKITQSKNSPVRINFDEKKYHTLNAISKSVLKYVVITIGGLSVLGNFIKIESLLTVAGVGGIAVAFGAQSLIEDMVSGFFILLEDQFSVDEYVTIGSFEGIIEDVGLRTTRIRGFSGDLHIIHNRNISEITNHARGNMRALIDVPVAYEEDVQRCIDILKDLCLEIGKVNDSIVEGPEVLGIEKLDESSVNIRIIAKTLPMEQWGVERLLRQRIKEEFDKENIEIPYAKMVIYKDN
ncbi:MAG: mechanosensitive ion channel family protein [Eubacteriales bacterium]